MEITTLLENTNRQLIEASPLLNQLNRNALEAIETDIISLQTTLANMVHITTRRMHALDEENQPHTIEDLLRYTAKRKQHDRLRRCLNTEKNSDKEFFVVDIEEGADDSKIITIRGTVGAQGTRSNYKVTVKREGLKCSCPDASHACREDHLVCKHVCFVVVRIGRLLPLYFFNAPAGSEGILVQSDLQKLLTILADRVAISHFSADRVPSAAANNFSPDVASISELCPICYDDTPPGTQLTSLACCPQCKHTMHVDCIKVWIEKSKTCVLCRYAGWKDFRPGH